MPICKKSALIASAGRSDLAELPELGELGVLGEFGTDEVLGGVDGTGLGTTLELGGMDEPVKSREQAAQPLMISVAESNKTIAARKNRFRFILPLRLGTLAGKLSLVRVCPLNFIILIEAFGKN